MKSLAYLLPMITAIALSASASAQQPVDDSSAYHLITVVADMPSPAGLRLIQSLRTHPRLSRIATKCKRFTWKASDPLYRARYAASLPPSRLPIIALVRSDGGVIYKATGRDIPADDPLADALIARAYGDRKSNPRTVTPPQPTGGPDFQPYHLQPQHGFRRPIRDRVRRAIPDTITVRPTVPKSIVLGLTAMIAIPIILLVSLVGLVILLISIATFTALK